ncbi:hypothetical protein BVRB_8g200810 [Beta vulgaris subsp. vulgaris]|uniref:Uncharacterized protein n=1 Tax=Beta vulgaris subsp. vulgaris TaxID=3555 RepID=A0A0J8E0M3_BETVV|nr:hypothetical protein BVRB_8g200810 [Beta vulgaris subsp. vulgaris]
MQRLSQLKSVINCPRKEGVLSGDNSANAAVGENQLHERRK